MDADQPLLEIVLDRAGASDLTEEQKWIVLAAFEGEEELRQEVHGGVDRQHARERAVARPTERPHAYLQAITVRGFRGVGEPASVRLQPRPGLTLVVGRNGSGKSSFAEGVEVALTGTSYRWKDKTVDWKGGWRNLHRPESPEVVVDLAVDGDRGSTTVTRTWPGEDVDTSECWAQRPGQPRAPLQSLGWDAALATHRPFLSYAELGQTIAGKPSEMYDALASILGLEQVTEAERRLDGVRKELDSARKAVEADLKPMLARLESLDDDRARAVHAALRRRPWRLDEAADAATGAANSGRTDELDTLRRLAQLVAPEANAVASAAVELRGAADALEEVLGTPAEESRRLADLLRCALDHHDRHADQASCPVCGTPGVLDAAWTERTRAEVRRLRDAAGAADAAQTQAADALRRARALLASRPYALPPDSPVSGAWREWAAGASSDGPARLAEHLERTYPVLQEACRAAREEASHRLAELDDRWRPVAEELAAWVRRARSVEAREPARRDVRKAYDWLRDTGLDLRNDRLRPLADRSGEIWRQLRQESNVDLGPIQLAGQANRRRVQMDVTVDGVGGAALGVMSQGELHALALSLFLPRATVPESPFGFLVVDDPVQSMDPAKVDGLSRVLAATAADRQVVVFTHDTRLPDALRRLDLPATVWQVVRRERSVVELREADDPSLRALDDARALTRTEELPGAVAAAVVPGLCRSALEAALVELAWRRRLVEGIRHADVGDEVARARGSHELAALAFFGDSARTGEVLARINRYGRWAGDTFLACKRGGHGLYHGNLSVLVDDTARLVERLRADR